MAERHESCQAYNQYLWGEKRVAASDVLQGPNTSFEGDQAAFVNDVRDALYPANMVSYTQGYIVIHAITQEYNWKLNYGWEVVWEVVWENGLLFWL